MSDRNDTQEGCAMDCEKRLTDLCTARRSSGSFTVFESARGRNNLCVGPVPEGHRMPREYVRHFVEKFEERNTTFMSKDEYCGC